MARGVEAAAAPQVVVTITGAEEASPAAATAMEKNPLHESEPKTEISTCISSPAKHQTKPPRCDSVLRRHSVLSKRNSRNSEGSPRPAAAADEEEDEEEEVYRREKLNACSNGGRRRRRCRWWTFRLMVEWPILLAATACFVCSLVVHRLQRIELWGLKIWQWCVMVVVVFSGRLLAHWLVLIVVFLVERNFLFKSKVLYFVYGLKRSFQVCIWSGLVLCSWLLLFKQSVGRSRFSTHALNHISRALASLWIASIMWLAKTLFVKLLASSFHVNKFFERIQISIFHQYILQTLSGPPLADQSGVYPSSARLSVPRRERKGKEKEVGVIDIAKLHQMKQEKVSAWTMKGLISTILGSGNLTIAGSIEDSMEMASGRRDGESIGSEWEAKAVGYRIFQNVAKPGRGYIDEEDLLRFLSREEIEIVLPLFPGAVETGMIRKSEMKNWVVKAYIERRSLAHSLTDTKTAVKQLHRLVSVLVLVVAIVIALLLMGLATTQVLVVISSQLLLVAFMFGNTCKTIFEGIIFVFVMHPFDVGDRCVVDGVQMVVEEMNILTTVFLRFDNEKIFYPNAVLATKPISNFYRSPDMNDSVEFSIDVFTPVERINAFKARLKSYLESKPQHWHPKHSVVVKEIVNTNRMDMVVYLLHTMNFQDIVEKNCRRTELLMELKNIFEQLQIRYSLLPLEVRLATPLGIGAPT